MLDLALGDQVFHRPRDILDRHVGVDSMLIVEVNHFDAQPLQRGIGNLPDVLRPAVHASHLAVPDIEPELGGDHHLVTERRQRLSDNLFVW
jgi:hypothetical protein